MPKAKPKPKSKTKAKKPKPPPPRTKGPRQKLYSQSAVVEAIRRVDLGELSVRQAAVEYGIPKSTLVDKITGKTPLDAARPGPNPLLTQGEEERLAELVVSVISHGQKCTKNDIREMAQKIIEADGRKTRCKDNKPGKSWIKYFLTRNPKLDVYFGKPKKDTISVEIVDQWFVTLNEYLQEKNCFGITECPERLWHLEEQPIVVLKNRTQVRGFRFKCASRKYSDQTSSSQVTTLLGTSASGLFSPPLISCPGMELPEGLGPPSAEVGNSVVFGGIDEDVFLNWLSERFHPFLINSGIQLPVVVLVDGHSKYITETVERECNEKGLVLFRLPTESSQAVSPYALVVQETLKDAYMYEQRSWRNEDPSATISMLTFRDVFRDAWDAISKKPLLGQIGFWCAGLYPFDGRFNKDKEEHPFFHELQADRSHVVAPSMMGTSSSAPLPRTVEVTIAEEHRHVLELLAATEGCEIILNDRTSSTSEGLAAGGSQSVSAHSVISNGRPQKIARTSLTNGDRLAAAASSSRMLKRASIAKKRKLQATKSAMLRKAQVSGERPGNEVQQKRWVLRNAKAAVRESERVVREAVMEVKAIRKELLVAEVVEKDARTDLRETKKTLKAAENDLRRLRLKDLIGQENPPRAWVGLDINEEECPVCGGKYEEGDVGQKLVSCCNCPRRYHVMCTDLFCVPQEKIPQVQYRCPFCAYL